MVSPFGSFATLFPSCSAWQCLYGVLIYPMCLSPICGTIRQYLCALRHCQLLNGGSDPALFSFHRLHYVLHGSQCSLPSLVRPRRLPITPVILRFLHRYWTPRLATLTRFADGLPVALVSFRLRAAKSLPVTRGQRITHLCCLSGM